MSLRLGLRLIPYLLAVACVVAGCKKTSTPPPSAPPTTAPGLPPLPQAQGGTTPAARTIYFKGSIGSSLDLQMKLVRADPQLTGSYFYQRIGTRINLKGTIDPDGKFVLEEFDPAGKQTGVFRGVWTVNAQDTLVHLAGFWSKPNQKEGDKSAAAFSVYEEPISLSGDVELVAKQIKESNKKLMYEIEVQYPQFSGGIDPNLEKFNQLVRGVVTNKVAGFKKDMAPAEGEEPRPEGSMGSDLGIAYDIALAQDDLISVEFDIGSYYQGAAHPNSYTQTVNYDLRNARQLKLSDLFQPGSKYLQAISAYCIADLKKQSKAKGDALPDDTLQSGASPTTKNYQSWKITRTGIGINFDSYQVGPYAAGPWYVLVPYANLKDLINPQGPIAQFAK